MTQAHRALAAYAAPPPDAEQPAALIERYRGLIQRVVRRMAFRIGNPDAADELWSAAALGLIEAARRYDGSREVKFETFAEHRMRGAVLDELRRNDHLPRRLRTRSEEISRAKAKLSTQLGRDASPEEVASELKLDVTEVANVEMASAPPLPLADALSEPSSETSAEESLSKREAVVAMADGIATLPERLQLVLSLYYVEELTLKEIAQVLGVSEPRVCQLHGEALKKLREKLAPAPEAP
ncbi:MAG: FliA/WhiG family RNA polymerase sigma factor [Deltaproteobacteria bacterium]|nr:FliA/WhiG family RNA polymerase sigma factor [Deltaproteobacteria bacterium]